MDLRSAYLDALGVQQWVLRTPVAAAARDVQWLIVAAGPLATADGLPLPEPDAGGQMLTAMLRGVGLAADQAYVLELPDVEARRLVQQALDQWQPRVMLLMGEGAVRSLLPDAGGFATLRGVARRWPGSDLPLVITEHPAQLLQVPAGKRQAWEELKLARSCWLEKAGP
jgi:uracil-DNA glycosylase